MLVTAGAMLGIFAVVNSESHGILDASTDGELIAAIVLLTGFFALESRPASPILPPRAMRRHTLIVTCAVRAMMVVGMFSSVYLTSLYIERIRGLNPITPACVSAADAAAGGRMSLSLTARLVKPRGAVDGSRLLAAQQRLAHASVGLDRRPSCEYINPSRGPPPISPLPYSSSTTSLDQAAAAEQEASSAHNENETPLYAQSIER